MTGAKRFMQKRLIKKGIVVGIIILFFGASVISAVDNNTEKKDNIVTKSNEYTGFVGLDDGLVGYWSFNEGSGSVVQDDSGNGNDGTMYGAAWTEGIFDDAIDYDGIDDYVDIGDVDTNVYTFSVWLKPEETITKSSPPSGFIEFTELIFRLLLGGCTDLVYDETICIQDIRGQNEYRTAVIDLDITHDSWHMITLVWNSGQNRYDIYYDSILQTVTQGNSNNHVSLMTCNDLKFGWITSQFFDGKIDEVRVYDRALNENEIQELFEKPSGLTSTFMFGRIDNLNTDAGNFITFDAEKVRAIQFSPFNFNTYESGETIRISEEKLGLLVPSFMFGLFDANI